MSINNSVITLTFIPTKSTRIPFRCWLCQDSRRHSNSNCHLCNYYRTGLWPRRPSVCSCDPAWSIMELGKSEVSVTSTCHVRPTTQTQKIRLLYFHDGLLRIKLKYQQRAHFWDWMKHVESKLVICQLCKDLLLNLSCVTWTFKPQYALPPLKAT